MSWNVFVTQAKAGVHIKILSLAAWCKQKHKNNMRQHLLLKNIKKFNYSWYLNDFQNLFKYLSANNTFPLKSHLNQNTCQFKSPKICCATNKKNINNCCIKAKLIISCLLVVFKKIFSTATKCVLQNCSGCLLAAY